MLPSLHGATKKEINKLKRNTTTLLCPHSSSGFIVFNFSPLTLCCHKDIKPCIQIMFLLCSLAVGPYKLSLTLSVYVSPLKLAIFKYSKVCSVSHHTVVNILCLICLYPPASLSPLGIITGQDIPRQCQTRFSKLLWLEKITVRERTEICTINTSDKSLLCIL